MTVRVTLRLPDAVYERIVQASRQAGLSLNQIMVDALREANFAAPSYGGMTPQERLNWELRDIGRPYTEEEIADLAWGDDEDLPLLNHRELRARLPRLDPPLSQMVIDDREDSV